MHKILVDLSVLKHLYKQHVPLFCIAKTVENNKNKKPVNFQGEMSFFIILFRVLCLPQITTFKDFKGICFDNNILFV